jgi:hypothetical protein
LFVITIQLRDRRYISLNKGAQAAAVFWWLVQQIENSGRNFRRWPATVAVKPVGKAMGSSAAMTRVNRPCESEHRCPGAFGEKAVEAELLRHNWIPANVNQTIKNAAKFDVYAVKGDRSVQICVKTCRPGMTAFLYGGFPAGHTDNDRRHHTA